LVKKTKKNLGFYNPFKQHW